MLVQLTINNFAIVNQLTIDFSAGMSVITGETGAGKSIAIDALNLCLGERAEPSMIRHRAAKADICAQFSLADAPEALNWLRENQLDDEQECLLRRVISQDGRSRGFINGSAVPLSQLRELGQFLIQIHGQHAHQLLLKADYQKQLLDHYAHYPQLLMEMRQAFMQWQKANQQLNDFRQQAAERESRLQLLQYQLKELNEFLPQPGEYEQIDEEYKRLANSGQLIDLSQQICMVLSEQDELNALSALHVAKQALQQLIELDSQMADLFVMLEEAAIQISEVSDGLRRYAEQLEVDPNRMYELEQRLAKQLALARKHRINPPELPQLHQQLMDEYQQIESEEQSITVFEQNVSQLRQQALSLADKLYQQRRRYAKELAKQITEKMHELSMPHGQFVIEVSHQPELLNSHGADKVDFLVTTNPGQPLQPLAKVASGGELSRIALAVQVITAEKMATPALIFDEVDVGISGPTAAKVGRLLRQLGESTQVMCVTHLPQVAGCGHQHYFVEKKTNARQTETSMQLLTPKARLEELARLLGGNQITKATLANAKELLLS